MSGTHLYQQIAEAMRREILEGRLKPGDRLPSTRQLTTRWNCTPGTVQRAYQELGRQGLVTSRMGQGTRVAKELSVQDDTPLRRAALVHRAETFLLEALTTGYTPHEVERAVLSALERWRAIIQTPQSSSEEVLRFVGSHDPVLDWLAAHFGEIVSGYTLELIYTGSLGGLIALAEGKADLAGGHLWDEESDTYNTPFVRRLLPGKRVALVTLAHRRIGLLLPADNPKRVKGLRDLARSGVRFVNRQTGSGTRVWLDAALRKLRIDPGRITGYDEEKLTHTQVARAVAEGQADVGVGLEAAALAYGLTFVFLTRERYDLVVPKPQMERRPVQALRKWLSSQKAKRVLSDLGGYDTAQTGKVEWIE